MNNLSPLRGLSPYGIRLFHPRSFEDAQEAILALKLGELLLVNVASLETTLAQRLADYLAGSVLALAGKHTILGQGVHIYAPPTFAISTHEAVA